MSSSAPPSAKDGDRGWYADPHSGDERPRVEGFVTPSGPITVPTCAGDSKAPELNPANDYESCILPAGGVLAAHKGADQTFIDEMIEITKDVWNEPEFNEWIASILAEPL